MSARGPSLLNRCQGRRRSRITAHSTPFTSAVAGAGGITFVVAGGFGELSPSLHRLIRTVGYAAAKRAAHNRTYRAEELAQLRVSMMFQARRRIAMAAAHRAWADLLISLVARSSHTRGAAAGPGPPGPRGRCRRTRPHQRRPRAARR